MEGVKDMKVEKDLTQKPALMILYQVMHLTMRRSLHLLEEYDLKPGQVGTLMTLSKKGGLSQRQVAKAIGVTPPSITVSLQKMEKQGYIMRKPDEKDQRIIRIEITDKGRECVVLVEKVVKQVDDILFEDMSAEEKMLFRRLLLQMNENLLKGQDGKEQELCPHII